ncbi:hypothetical protein ABH922_001540 [Rhodococcus sp. 27YEA15]|uniref:hypothetical protein n=1 Tax=Rhodococcus sp. 27YEA15 TaxID=3156259 RepID=UPI003C7A351E
MSAAAATRRVHVPRMDVVHAGPRITSVIGPVEVPSADVIRKRLSRMVVAGAHTRLGLQPSPSSNRWMYDPTFTPGVSTLERHDQPSDLLDPPALRGHDSSPLSVTTSGDYLRTDHDHGLGEIDFGLIVHAVILGSVDPTDPTIWARSRRSMSGVGTALVRTFGSDPRRAVALMRDLRSPRPAPPVFDGPTLPWTPHRSGAVSTATAATLDTVKSWRDRHATGVSMFAVNLAVWHRALAAEGITIDPVSTIPFDGRRYLAENRSPLGNFVAGLQFRLGDRPSPRTVHDQISTAARTGRPVANLALTCAKSRLARGGSFVPTTVAANPSAHIIFSHLGTVPRSGSIAWKRAGAPAFYVAHSDPAGPDGLTLTSAVVDGSLITTGSFHANVFDARSVARALDNAAQDPLQFLSAR